MEKLLIDVQENTGTQQFKLCTYCKKQLLYSCFSKNKNNKDGLSCECKRCAKERQIRNKEKYANDPIVDKKICHNCKIEKPASAFRIDERIKGKLHNWCMECERNRAKLNREANKKDNELKVTVFTKKVCPNCGEEKDTNKFHRDATNKSGFSSWCKDCDSKRRQDKKEKLSSLIVVPDKKVCPVCKEEKENTYFYRNSFLKDGLSRRCIACMSIWKENAKSLKINYRREHYYDALKEYRQKNKDKIKEKTKEWINNNRERHNARNAVYSKQRYKDNVLVKLRTNLHNRIKYALKKDKKVERTMVMLGCSITEFRRYFESKFTVGMSWDKFMSGDIVIDHIIPCKFFNLSDYTEQKMCFYVTNLQPLWFVDNSVKGARLDWDTEYTRRQVLLPFHATYIDCCDQIIIPTPTTHSPLLFEDTINTVCKEFDHTSKRSINNSDCSLLFVELIGD